jgi:hypothetical protein
MHMILKKPMRNKTNLSLMKLSTAVAEAERKPMRKKGQTSIAGFLIITLIILVVVSGTFFWAKEFIDDSNHINDMSRMENRMIELDKAIREVANEQSQRSVDFEIKEGYLFIENNHTITFTFERNPPPAFISKGTASLGNASKDGPCFNYTILGNLGVDRSSCIVKKGRDISVNYIMLNDSTKDKCYSVQFESGGTAATGKGSHKVLLTYSHTNTTTDCVNTSYVQVIKVDMS